MNSVSLARCFRISAVAAVLSAVLHTSAFAHVGGHGAGVVAGLAHPFSGLDHVLAMVAVGLWASQLGRPAVWVLPLTFPAVMALGAVLGATGMAPPWLEIGVAGSVLALGAAVALAWRPAVAVGAALVAAFALLHGWSHGTELPQAGSALAYGVGFILATLALHGTGLALGAVSFRPAGRVAARAAGAAVALCGAALIVLS
jgi:urease accessory protein